MTNFDLDELQNEGDFSLEKFLQKKVVELKTIKARIDELETELKKLENLERKIEGEEIPSLLDEFQLDAVKLKNGLKISLNDKVFTRVNSDDSEAAWQILKDLDRAGVITPVVSVQVSSSEDRKSIDDLVSIINNSIENQGISLTFKYHAGTLNAVMNDLMSEGIELKGDVFKTFIKRGVKITEQKK